MRKVCITLFVALICSTWQVGAQTSTVNIGKTNQVIDGFGASSAWCGTIGDNVMNSLYGDLGFSILRLRVEEAIGDAWKTGNFSKWSPELANAKKAAAKGAKVFASPWNPPASMQENFTKSGDSDAKRLRYDKYSEYVDYLNAYVKYMKDNGVNLHAISVQNEPDYAQDWNWWTPTEMLNFMKNYASKINCKVIAPESFQYLKNMSDPILNDATAFENMDILGFHLYGTPVNQFAYPLYQSKGPAAGKKIWMTEHFLNEDDDMTKTIMPVAKEIHDCMVTGNMNAYVYWWITWANGLATSSGTIYKRAYVIGQFSKFIRPDYYRVDATANPKTNVYVSAYTGGNKVVIVAINTNTSAQSQTFALQNGSVLSVMPYTTDGSRNMATGTAIAVSNGSFTVQLPAQSITTFVGDLANAPKVAFTAPANNSNSVVGTAIELAATATIGTGSIASVKFFDGTTLLSTDNSSPYSYSWTTATAGTHKVVALATDNTGKTTTDTITIKVNPAQAAYGGTPWPIPGKIEFENFDVGGNGFAYNDATAGTQVSPAPAFRADEDVDVETCTDAGTGYNVGYATAGEWLEYTVNVAKAGKYDLTLRVACNGDGRTLSLSAKDVVVAKDVAIANTAGWQTWKDVTVTGISLDARVQVIRITMGASDYVNMNYMTFTAQSQVKPTLSLKKGWNLVGYPLDGSTDIATALASIWPNVTVVKDLDSFYDNAGQAALNSLSKVSFGKGYYVKVSADCVLTW